MSGLNEVSTSVCEGAAPKQSRNEQLMDSLNRLVGVKHNLEELMMNIGIVLPTSPENKIDEKVKEQENNLLITLNCLPTDIINICDDIDNLISIMGNSIL